ncbi:MAG: ABC transporter substrate-binding protein [Pseudomonadota bacterium]
MSAAQRMDRRALFASGAAAALLAATGVSAGSLPRRGGRLRLALSGARRDDAFDPQLLTVLDQREGGGLFLQIAMAGVVFETLTEIASDGTLRGELATGWRSNAASTIWDFDLRANVSFHNGKDFSAEDVAGLTSVTRRVPALRNVSNIQALAPDRVRFELLRPEPQLPFLLSDPGLSILPATGRQAAIEQGIGTGPYVIRKFDPGRHLIAERLERHHKDGRAAWFDSVEMVGISAGAVRAEALREQLVDAADLATTADLEHTDGLVCLPDGRAMTCAVDQRIALPAQLGATWPLDDLRAPQRWWIA